MRSEGQVRFIKFSSRAQIATASLVALVSVGYVGSMGAMAVDRYLDRANQVALLEREAEVATSEARLNAYGDDMEAVTVDLLRSAR